MSDALPVVAWSHGKFQQGSGAVTWSLTRRPVIVRFINQRTEVAAMFDTVISPSKATADQRRRRGRAVS